MILYRSHFLCLLKWSIQMNSILVLGIKFTAQVNFSGPWKTSYLLCVARFLILKVTKILGKYFGTAKVELCQVYV